LVGKDLYQYNVVQLLLLHSISSFIRIGLYVLQ